MDGMDDLGSMGFVECYEGYDLIPKSPARRLASQPLVKTAKVMIRQYRSIMA